ncbi:MAG: ABC transporter substrate-binding protein [Zestosphaera sp.]
MCLDRVFGKLRLVFSLKENRMRSPSDGGGGPSVHPLTRAGLSKLITVVIVAVVLVSIAGAFTLLNYAPTQGVGTSTRPATTPTSLKTPTTTTLPAGSVGGGGRVLRVGIGIDADTLDPAGQTTTTISNIVRFFAEPLFLVDSDGSLKPLLAESYEVSPDGRNYTIRLRGGIKFHDGTPLNASAVKYSLERLLNPNVKVPSRAYYTIISRIEVLDELTVRLVLKEPYAPFITVLSFTQAAIISPKAVEALGDSITTSPLNIGTGPFRFKEWVKGDRIVLVRNENYWNGTPYFSEVVFKVVPDAQTRTAMLLAGDLDIIIQPSATDVEMLSRRSDVRVIATASNRVMYVGINTQYGPLRDVRVRQALNYAVDKDAIVKNVLFGLGQVMDSPVPSYTLGHVTLGPYSYDPSKAKELLREAGYPNGFRITLITPTGRYVFDKQVAEAIAQYLREVGIEVEVRTYDWPTYVSTVLAPLNKTEVQLFLLGWSPGSPDPHFYLYQRFHSTQFTPNGFNNFFYNRSRVDKLLDEGVRNPNPAVRAAIYEEVNRLIWEDAPNIFLYLQYFIVVTRADLVNVKVFPYEMFDLTYARLSS